MPSTCSPCSQPWRSVDSATVVAFPVVADGELQDTINGLAAGSAWRVPAPAARSSSAPHPSHVGERAARRRSLCRTGAVAGIPRPVVVRARIRLSAIPQCGVGASRLESHGAAPPLRSGDPEPTFAGRIVGDEYVGAGYLEDRCATGLALIETGDRSCLLNEVGGPQAAVRQIFDLLEHGSPEA